MFGGTWRVNMLVNLPALRRRYGEVLSESLDGLPPDTSAVL